MTEHTQSAGGQRMHHWHKAIWGAAALVLLVPLVAMQFTDEVAWDLADFIVFGAMLIAACSAYELATRMSASGFYRAAFGLAIATAFFLVWANLAVGIIGNENNPVNLMCYGVLAVGIAGAIIARFKPLGMARALFATALAHALTIVFAVAAGLSTDVIIAGLFVSLWLISAWSFRKAAREQVAPNTTAGR